MLVCLVLFFRMMRLCVKNGVCVLYRFSSMLLWFVIGIICIFVICGVCVCVLDLIDCNVICKVFLVYSGLSFICLILFIMNR